MNQSHVLALHPLWNQPMFDEDIWRWCNPNSSVESSALITNSFDNESPTNHTLLWMELNSRALRDSGDLNESLCCSLCFQLLNKDVPQFYQRYVSLAA